QRLAAWRAAPLDELLTVLLRQFKRLLLGKDLPLSDAGAAQIAAALVRHDPPDERMERLRAALIALVEESEAVLGAQGLSFAAALKTDVAGMPGWESTADFLALAEDKANAELRISTGSALLVLLGERRFGAHLAAVLDRAAATGQYDLDAVIAERALQSASGANPADKDWRAQAEAWYSM
ncbi:MAG: hypothetical protein JNL34_08025, partial [Anaerolineae bacterium]|nr:hypothetical protein [Anaerolineae bacterium]